MPLVGGLGLGVLAPEELADIACALRSRVERPADSRYRLVGVGLSGFVDADDYAVQTDLFGMPTPD